jgi:hypothetical protein
MIEQTPKNARVEYSPRFPWENTKQKVGQSAPPMMSILFTAMIARAMDTSKSTMPPTSSETIRTFFFTGNLSFLGLLSSMKLFYQTTNMKVKRQIGFCKKRGLFPGLTTSANYLEKMIFYNQPH